MSKSTKSRRRSKSQKPPKPYADYPLFPHDSGRWAKKIRGRLRYFGRWGTIQNGKMVPVEDVGASAQEAVDLFKEQRDDLYAGRTPPPVGARDGCVLGYLCDSFLTSKRNKLDSGELSERSYRDYYDTCARMIDYFGNRRLVDDLRPDDFEGFRKSLAKRFGTVTLKNEINRCRVVFKYAADQRLIDRPVNYGQSFNRPSAKMLRKARNEAGPRLFEADELRKILDALDGKKVTTGETDPETGKPVKVKMKADPVLKAMVLLGVNCGFGNTDVASLPQSAVDLDGGWIDFPRPKTEIQRRVPLWPETVKALKAAIDVRPKPKDRTDADLCFLTNRGNPWVRVRLKRNSDEKERKYVRADMIAERFSKLLKTLGINGRKGLGFYTLRHVFETVAGESRDQVAVNAIMGHVDNTMAGVYRERISDERLRDVVKRVRQWLKPWIIGYVALQSEAAKEAVKRLADEPVTAG